MVSTVYSAGLSGIDGFCVTVECDAKPRLPELELVGLPDAAVKEARERVIKACENSGIRFPHLALTVNLAPADRRKEGSAFDLAILVSILHASGIVRADLSGHCFAGELSLSGRVREIRGALCLCAAAQAAGLSEFYVAAGNAPEASAVRGMRVYPVESVAALVDHLNGRVPIAPLTYEEASGDLTPCYTEDFADVRGQALAKRAMEVAAAGGHNILLIGPPGTGKSMLAKRLPTILPPLRFDEALEVTKIHSVAGTLAEGQSLLRTRPFRSPHHTMSAVSLVGGGVNPRPGEISLAHHGVLFLDELPEFPRTVTDSLRQPIEDGRVTITRAAGRITYPSSFMLVAAMNPCRCGYFGHPDRPCTCREGEVARYISKISGPLLDRMDIQIELPSLTYEEISGSEEKAESSAVIRERVMRARAFARERVESLSGGRDRIFSNADMTPAMVRKYCTPDEAGDRLLKQAYETLGLSARGYDRMLRVARTVADLDGCEVVRAAHVTEAIFMRSLDKKYWR